MKNGPSLVRMFWLTAAGAGSADDRVRFRPVWPKNSHCKTNWAVYATQRGLAARCPLCCLGRSMVAIANRCGQMGELMEWARILAYISGTVDQELLLRNEYLAAENQILRNQLKGRPKLSDAERAKLGEIGRRLGRKAL